MRLVPAREGGNTSGRATVCSLGTEGTYYKAGLSEFRFSIFITYTKWSTTMKNPELPKATSSENLPAPSLPELALQYKIEENEALPDHKTSGNLWYWQMADGIPFDTETKAKMLVAQKRELPNLVSGVLERTCNLQCDHCLYMREDSSAGESERTHLFDTIKHLVREIPHESEEREPPKFMSAGRILRPSHLKLFEELRSIRPDVALGVIDNGTYTKLRARQWPEGFKFDWMDISIDGTEEHHNQQRDPKGTSPLAYADAIRGLEQAREVTRGPEEGGYVSSLLTLTTINAGDIKQVAERLLENREDGLPLVDRLNITTVSPTNAINAKMEISVEDLTKTWADLVEVCGKYNEDGATTPRISLNIYRVADMEKLAAVLGEKKFLAEFLPVNEDEADAKIDITNGMISTVIDGVSVSYLPLSIWPTEEFLIEADAAYRVAYEGQFTLAELQSGISAAGVDTKPFTVEQLTPESDFDESFEHAVDHYWQNFGSQKLDDEVATFARIRAKANQ
jgi:hypothetical protein